MILAAYLLMIIMYEIFCIKAVALVNSYREVQISSLAIAIYIVTEKSVLK